MFGRLIWMVAAAGISAALLAPIGYARTGKPQHAAIEHLKNTITKTIGAESNVVEIEVTDKVFKVRLVNGKFNEATLAGRENEAAAIERIVASEIVGRPRFAGIVVMYVEYVHRGTTRRAHIIDTIEFRKTPSGTFRHHNS